VKPSKYRLERHVISSGEGRGVEGEAPNPQAGTNAYINLGARETKDSEENKNLEMSSPLYQLGGGYEGGHLWQLYLSHWQNGRYKTGGGGTHNVQGKEQFPCDFLRCDPLVPRPSIGETLLGWGKKPQAEKNLRKKVFTLSRESAEDGQGGQGTEEIRTAIKESENRSEKSRTRGKDTFRELLPSLGEGITTR